MDTDGVNSICIENGSVESRSYGILSYSGKNAENQQIQSLIREFSDVLVSKFPAEMAPASKAVDGINIQHIIKLDPETMPCAAQPRPLTRDEGVEIQRRQNNSLDKEWIAPSSSPHAAPVVFVRRKPDPVTGRSALC
jgi:hypothetical protein